MLTADVTSRSLARAFFSQFLRHGKCLIASPANIFNPIVFFCMVIVLFPLGLGPNPSRLASLSPGILWVVALLSSLMVSMNMFASDYDDGSLEQMAMSPYPLSLLALGEIFVYWLGTGFILSISSPIFALMLGLPKLAFPTLIVSLLLGTLCLTLFGALGSALTIGVHRGGLLMSLIIIPFHVPVLIFGSISILEAVNGGNVFGWLSLMAGLACASLALIPMAIGFALRISLEN